MSFAVFNRTNGLADINLFDGRRISLLKGQNHVLDHEPSESEVRYYSKLNCVGIYLDKVEDVVVSVNYNTNTESSSSIDSVESTDITFTGDSNAESEDVVIDYTSMDFNKLMQMRQAELIDIAHNLGHDEANAEMAKKEICKLIRGE